jgi:FAD/FMN-containing dehydrogenase
MEYSALVLIILAIVSLQWMLPQPAVLIVNDIPTGLNPIKVADIYAPNASTWMDEIQDRVRFWKGPISIGGGRFSMGGQIATEDSLHIDMRQFVGMTYPFMDSYDKILVAAGTTWRQVIDVIDPYNRSVKVMQSYADFTVGGSLSVNCHGRYAKYGAIVESVLSMLVMFSDGQTRYVYPKTDPQLFGAIIGGYGGIALILYVELRLVPNLVMARMTMRRDKTYLFTEFIESTLQDQILSTVLYNVNIVPPEWEKSEAIFWGGPSLFLSRQMSRLNQETNKSVWDIPKPKQYQYEGHVFALQEYFIPRNHANAFLADMTDTLKFHRAAIHNLSVRGIRQDKQTVMSWAQHDGYSFVLAYSYDNDALGLEHVQYWTNELIDIALNCGGSFYLPYRLHATCDQFTLAYPRFMEWLAIKAKHDPNNRFRNKLWDKYMLCQPRRQWF